MPGDGAVVPAFESFRRITVAIADPASTLSGSVGSSGVGSTGVGSSGVGSTGVGSSGAGSGGLDSTGDELMRYARMLTAVAPADVSFRFVHVMGRLISGTHRAALEALTRAASRHLGSEVAWECH